MATAKQRAWRAKFARLYGGGKKRSSPRPTRKTRARRSVSVMSRRRYSRRSSGGGLLRGSGMLPPVAKNALAGWGAASAVEMLGFGGLIPAAAAGFIAAGPTGAAGGVGKTLLKGVDLKGVGGQIASNAIG